MTDKNKINEDDITQDPGPLFVPFVELRLVDFVTHENYDDLYRRVKIWFNAKFPHVLWQMGFYDKDQPGFRTSRIYFSTRELYVEFLQTFPEFLRGDDGP